MRNITPRRFLSCFATLIAAGLLFSSLAAAAPVSLEDSEMWVQLWPEGEPGTNVLIIGVDLPEGTQFPATVQLPVPDGATVFWAGEIVGPDPSTDIAREFNVVETETGKVVEFTVESTTAVQYDATYGTIVVDGNDLISTLDWRQSVKSSSTAFAVLTPAGTGDVEITPAPPGDPQENERGERLYTLSTALLGPGDDYQIKVVYRRAGVKDLDDPATGTVLWVLGGLLVAAVVALAVTVVAQKRRA